MENSTLYIGLAVALILLLVVYYYYNQQQTAAAAAATQAAQAAAAQAAATQAAQAAAALAAGSSTSTTSPSVVTPPSVTTTSVGTSVNPWQCIMSPSAASMPYTIVQMNPSGLLECASEDGSNCFWYSDLPTCQSAVPTMLTQTLGSPVVCTATQAATPTHWCSVALPPAST